MTALVVNGAQQPLQGMVPCPPDARMATFATLIAARLAGESRIHARALPKLGATAIARTLGAEVQHDNDLVTVRGQQAPIAAQKLDAGRDLSLVAITAGLLSSLAGGGHELRCAPTVSGKALDMIATTLRQRGAQIEGRLDPTRPGELSAPLRIDSPPGGSLGPLNHEVELGRWPAKLAALSSGLGADGTTVLFEPLVSFDGAERLLRAIGCKLSVSGTMLELTPTALPPFEVHIAGDPSLAAYILAAASAVSGSRVGIRGIGTAPARAGWSRVLRASGAELIVTPGPERAAESCSDMWLCAPPQRGLDIDGELALQLGWELPACAAFAAGLPRDSHINGLTSRFDGDGEIPAVVRMLQHFGISCRATAAGIDIATAEPVPPAQFDPQGDPHIAMAATAMALRGSQPCTIVGVERISECFPRFVATLRALGATIEVQT